MVDKRYKEVKVNQYLMILFGEDITGYQLDAIIDTVTTRVVIQPVGAQAKKCQTLKQWEAFAVSCLR
jgi:hypothetical protein